MDHKKNDSNSQIELFFVANDFQTPAELLSYIQCTFHHFIFFHMSSDTFFRCNYLAKGNGRRVFVFDINAIGNNELDQIMQSCIADSSVFFDYAASFANAYRLMLQNCTRLWSPCSDFSRMADIIRILPGMSTNRCEQIRQYCNDNLGSDLSLPVLASIFHMSQNYLSALFRKHCGMTLTEYIQRGRIEQAKKMILNSNEDIQSISLKCGFSSVKYFDIVFKKNVGTSPSRYRHLKPITVRPSIDSLTNAAQLPPDQ